MVSRKGQQDILSAVMLTGIMVVVVGSVYFWGIPLVQKNRDVNALQNTEDFMKLLNDKIKFVANNEGREQIQINVPVILTFVAADDKIQVEIETDGSIYSSGAPIPLSRTESCDNVNPGTWGTDQPEILCVTTTELAENAYKSVYSLEYRELAGLTKDYQINLEGAGGSIGQDHNIVMEYDGSETVGGILNTKIKITLL